MRKISLSLSFVIIAGILTGSACSDFRSGPLPPLQITQPQDGNVFGQGTQINVTMQSNANRDNLYDTIEWQIYEDGLLQGQGTGPGSQNILTYNLPQNNVGTHVVFGRVRGHRRDVASDWINSNVVCFYVGDNAPSDFCSTQTLVEPVIISTFTPSPTLPPTATSTATEIPTIPVRHNPHQTGSGCGQYTSQNSCNLAGCSWNGSSCSVNP